MIAYNDGGDPFFSYFGYQPTGSPRLDTLRLIRASGTLTTAQLGGHRAHHGCDGGAPARAPDQKISTRLEDSVHLRTSDPNKNTPEPTCR